MDLMIPENRFAEILVDVHALDVEEWTDAHYSCLGYYIGNQVGGMKNIAINGLPKHLPFDFKRALILPLAHIRGHNLGSYSREYARGSHFGGCIWQPKTEIFH